MEQEDGLGTLTFLGGAGTVTGSKTLLRTARGRLLVDCGLFQGHKELRLRNWEDLPVRAAEIDAVLLTHAHLDHCGHLPRLVRQGFWGPVYCTAGTRRLAEIVLLDSGRLQEEQAEHANRHGYSKHTPALPLYTEDDARACLPLLTEVELDRPVEVLPDVTATWRRSGHILGAATITLDVRDAAHADGCRVAFSGDLGRASHPLLLPPAPIGPADIVVTESTYGDQTHPAMDTDVAIAEAIHTILRHDAVLVIPAFAVDRTEVVLVALHELREAGEIPDVPIHLDSPMGLQALRVYMRAIDRDEYRPGAPTAALTNPALHFAASTEESIRLNAPAEPCIIVSSSGMATGGRVLHHLRAMLPDRANSVVLVGYQAMATRGRDLLEGARQVKIHGMYVPVRAEIVDLSGYSVHADSDELIAWLARCPEEPDVVYLVHGEPESSAALATRIAQELQWTAVVARDGELVRLRSATGPRRADAAGTAVAAAGGAAVRS